MMTFTDQMGNILQLPAYPCRIISLVPSQTELLFDLELDEEIVGVTEYCILPAEKVMDRVKVGGPKAFHFETIDALHPDLLIGNKEENYLAGIRQLQEKYPVWMSDIFTVEDALEMIRGIGALVNRLEHAEKLMGEITTTLERLPAYPSLKVAYLIWKDPYIVAGGHTFINEMLKFCGFVNIFEERSRYPHIAFDELAEADVILLSSEPYSFTSEDIEALGEKFSLCRVCLVDGMIFSWYGSRLKYAPAYFRKLREGLCSDSCRAQSRFCN